MKQIKLENTYSDKHRKWFYFMNNVSHKSFTSNTVIKVIQLLFTLRGGCCCSKPSEHPQWVRTSVNFRVRCCWTEEAEPESTCGLSYLVCFLFPVRWCWVRSRSIAGATNRSTSPSLTCSSGISARVCSPHSSVCET